MKLRNPNPLGSFFVKHLLFSELLVKLLFFVVPVVLILASVYTVDANENAVILRLGKYYETQGSGLGFKIPLIENLVVCAFALLVW